MIAEITQDAELLKRPKDGGPSHGILPKGTLLRLTGEQEGGLYSVEVELEQGTMEGWVRQDRLNLEEQQREQEASKAKKKSDAVVDKEKTKTETVTTLAPKPRKRARLRVPSDESLLLHRETSFFFGVHGGMNWGMIRALDGATEYAYSGMGFTAGGHFGMFLAKVIPVRFELTYTNLSGADSTTGNTTLGAGFADIGASIGYLVDDFELFANLHYGFGVSITSLPGGLNTSFPKGSSFSTFFIGAGAGYTFLRSELTNVSARAYYSISFLQNPLGFQSAGLQLVFDMKG